MRLRVNGANELAKKLDNMSNLNEVKRAVQKNGLGLQRYAKVIAPVDTGFLKRSIRLYIEDGGLKARIVSEAEYAGIQEKWYTPHIKPAFIKYRQKFLLDLRRAVNGGRS